MSKPNELKLYQREHLDKKIDKKLEPEIEREELKLKATVAKILDKGTKQFAVKIGADKILARLKKAEEEMRLASRQAFVFFDREAQKSVRWDKSRAYRFNKDDFDEKSVSVSECEDQLEKWAEQQAKQVAEQTPQGQRLVYLRALQENAKDKVKEATVAEELIATLDNLFTYIGISWEKKLPALPRPRK
jgi:hypothetical protein